MRFVFAFVFVLLSAVSAEAACQVEEAGSPPDIALAQAMVRESEYPRVHDAWSAGTCTITKLLHDGGRPCQGVARHVTVRVDGRTYHVIEKMRARGYCTTW